MEPRNAQRWAGRRGYPYDLRVGVGGLFPFHSDVPFCPNVSCNDPFSHATARRPLQTAPAHATRLASSNRHSGRTKITLSYSKHSIGRLSNRHGNRVVRVSNSPTLAHPPALTLLALDCYAEKRTLAPALAASIAKRGLHRAYGGPHGYHGCPGSL